LGPRGRLGSFLAIDVNVLTCLSFAMRYLLKLRNLSKSAAFMTLLLGLASPALADPAGDAAREKANALYRRGGELFAQATTAASNGDNAGACRLYRDSATVLENAIFATAGMVYDPAYDKDKIKAANATIQERVDSAKENAAHYCGLSAAPVKSQATVDSENRAFADAGYRQKLYQADINTAWLNASDAAEHYAAKRFVEACAASRNASAIYARTSRNRLDSDARKYTSTNEHLVDENAARAAADETEFYCKDLKVAATAPAAFLPTGTRSERVTEGLRHQTKAMAANPLALTEFEAKQFGQSCNHFREVSDQWNQYLLLNSIYQKASNANPDDPKDFETIKSNRDRAEKNAALACDNYKAEWLAKSWPSPSGTPNTTLTLGGKDYSSGLKAFYAFVSHWQSGVSDSVRTTELYNTCDKAQPEYTPLSRACDAVMSRYPNPKIEPCWHLEQGSEGLVGLGGLQVPELGMIYEQLNARMSCKPFRLGYSTYAGYEALQWANGLVVIVVKPLPNRPERIVPRPLAPAAPKKAAAKPKPAVEKKTKAR
jgi:hypothetical protein